jgi:hypothetical protein
MNHITLPSGATADIRAVADVTERMRRPIKRVQAKLAADPEFAAAVATAEALKEDGEELTQEEQLSIAAGLGSAFDDLELVNDLLVAAMVAGWSYDFPVSADACQDLTASDLDALRKAVAPFLPQLNPDFEPTPDADSPTVASTA